MKTLSKKEKNRLIFYISVVALPVVQFLIFYIIVNFRSILLAFQTYVEGDGYSFAGFDNFVKVVKNFSAEKKMTFAIKNSFVLYFFTLVIGTGGAVLFSNYIYKKNFGHKFFQIVLFLPHIISGVVLVTIYKLFLNQGMPKIGEAIGKEILPMLTKAEKPFTIVLIFQLWMGFGTQVLMYTSTMSGISKEVVESAELDGITPVKELIFITLPMIYPTFVTFITVGVAGLFTNQMSLYSFYGDYPPTNEVYTLGYYLFVETQKASKTMPPDASVYTYVSAMGILFTLVAVPLTFLVKKAMEKFGPSVD